MVIMSPTVRNRYLASLFLGNDSIREKKISVSLYQRYLGGSDLSFEALVRQKCTGL